MEKKPADKKFYNGYYGGQDNSYYNDGYYQDGWSELSFDDLEGIAGGAGSNSTKVVQDGTVIGFQGPGVLQVNVEGQTVIANLSGKMRMNYIRVAVGDIVRVEYYPDTLKGLITWRYK